MATKISQNTSANNIRTIADAKAWKSRTLGP